MGTLPSLTRAAGCLPNAIHHRRYFETVWNPAGSVQGNAITFTISGITSKGLKGLELNSIHGIVFHTRATRMLDKNIGTGPVAGHLLDDQ